MLGVVFIGGVAFLLYRLLGGAPRLRLKRSQQKLSSEAKIEDLLEYASRLRASNKYTGAEKVYLQILKIDHKHVPTYSRLGTLYSAQRNYPDAVNCFEMAAQLQPSGSTYFNLGLAYFENRNHMKAIAAFEKSVMFEPTLQRHIGLAKAFKKTGDIPRMVSALEQAVNVEENPKVLWLLAEGYETVGRTEDMTRIHERIRELDPKDPKIKAIPKPSATVTAASATVEKPNP